MAEPKGSEEEFEILDEEDLNIDFSGDGGELDSNDDSNDDVTGAVGRARANQSIYRLMNKWREEDILGLVEDAKEIEYHLNADELNMITDFIVPDKVSQIIKCLETAIAAWFRLGFHMENIADLEQAAFNDLVTKRAKVYPEKDTADGKKYTESERSNIAEKETVEEKDYYRKVKKVRKKLNLLVSCVKEFVNVLKKLLDYYNNVPSMK